MKVKYAAHTLSSSVANAITIIKSKQIQEFENCEATTIYHYY